MEVFATDIDIFARTDVELACRNLYSIALAMSGERRSNRGMQRPNRDSARWCLACVEQCWREKAVTYTGEERATAEADYAVAREFFSRVAE